MRTFVHQQKKGDIMRKLNYLDNISYIKINNKNIYIKSNKNIHILNKLLQEIKNKEKLKC